jgi:hypothetical protein
MWIPTPVQERLPMFWLLLGLLFIATGIFLGFDYSATFIYLAIGVACVFWSFCIVALRPRKPQYTWTEPASVGSQSMGSGEEPFKQSMAQPILEPLVDVSELTELPADSATDLPDEDR